MEKEVVIKDVALQERILLAAERLFVEQGFAGTSTVQIAREVGCNQALVHYYFRTKEMLFHRIFESKLRMFADIFFAERSGDYLSCVERIVTGHFDILRANPRLPRFIMTEVASNPHRLLEIRDSLSPLLFEVVGGIESDMRAAALRGEIREMDVWDLFFTVVSLNASTFMLAPVLQELAGGSDEVLEEFLDRRRAENVRTVMAMLKL